MSILRIMTFNLRVNSSKDGLNAWPLRAARAIALIRKYQPDVIGFQELQAMHWAALAADLPAYGRERGPQVDNQEPWAHPAIFWNVDRLHLKARGGVYLSKTPGRFSRDWESAYTRGATWVQLRLNDLSRTPILFLNAHLDNQSEAARNGQAGVLVATAAQQRRAVQLDGTGGQPVFITGDFNCDSRSAVYAQFVQAGYRDAFREAGGQDGPATATFHGFTGKQAGTVERMDWILFQAGRFAIQTVAGEILRDAEPPLYPSDHFPVMATVRIGEN